MTELLEPIFEMSHAERSDTHWLDGPQHAPSVAAVPRRPVERQRPRLVTQWARHQDEVRAAQRLRHQVFAGEMGARLPGTLPGHDIDRFDDYCEHLLVRDAASEAVVGTYRVLTPSQARRAGGTYTDTEFDLAALDDLRPHMVELGRSCVHADHRHGGVILALWAALTDFMHRNRLASMIGCASIPMQHNGIAGGHAAASIWRRLSASHPVPEGRRVQPRIALPTERLDTSFDVEAPALVRGYLRMGARLLGPPAWDPDFNVADLPMLMHVENLPERYRSRQPRP
ncbi:Ornithine-acyl-ACP acyltransferase [Burkholderiales bacterium 8X]|nr:Ornithine-acyl-ACP acyltransferase [Burkholderiales bacterium 8X]